MAGGLWFPYSVQVTDDADMILGRSRTRFELLVDDPSAAVGVREGTFVERSTRADRSWTEFAIWHRPARPDELPRGAASGIRAALPLVNTPAYLLWLDAACRTLGVRFERANVRDLGETITTTRADLLVVAAGVKSASLLGDDNSSYPIRGQVVRLRNPGLRDWLLDDDHPDGLTYVLPRVDDVVCGGTAVVGATDTTWDPEVEAAILRRTTATVPALAGLEVLGSHVGLRPGRPTLRLEAVSGYPVPMIACYGHGGAGITLSWGSAERVTELARTLLAS